MLDSDLEKQYRNQIESMRSMNHSEFFHLSDQVYFNHAANTIYLSSLIKAYHDKLTANSNWSLFSNPHSQSQSGIYTNLLVDSIREKILANLFGTSSVEYDLVFVLNATAGLKLLGESFGADRLVYFLDNHTSVIGMREIGTYSEVYCVNQNEEMEGKFNCNLVKSTKNHLNRYKK